MMEPYIIVRLRRGCANVWSAGRWLNRNGMHGNLHCLPLKPALRLIDAGQAKLLPHQRVSILRAQCSQTTTN